MERFSVYFLKRTSVRICHPTTAQGMLKLCTHETIPFTRILQDQEMDLEHGHIKYDRNEDETESAGVKVPDPQLRCHA